MPEETIFLTQEAYDKLAAELEYLEGEGREAIAKKIGRARDEGDLSENAGYHAAREEQGQQEARIKELRFLLENAQVGAVEATDEVVPGVKVTVYYDGDEDDDDTFMLGSREVQRLDETVDIDVYSPQSPLGAAILGAKVGQSVQYVAPNGKTIEVTIAKIEA
ncbi:MAG: transcription elongation factor GreA [Propionibacteriaceae bacterium]|nr:transcription elongation factor GreA [Propionibacteriaceae bacterium]